MDDQKTTEPTDPTAANGKSKDISVVTHNGVFHADDVMACAILNRVFDGDLRVSRTRDAVQVAMADIVVDVGGVYDADKQRFDHHQRGGAGVRDNDIPFAACGLVWREYGAAFVASVALSSGLLSKFDVASVCKRVDATVITSIDAADNGIDQGSGFTVSSVISQMNPVWFQKPSEDEFDAAFSNAVVLAADILEQTVISAIAEEMAEIVVLTQIEEMRDAGYSYIVLRHYCPWIPAAVKAGDVDFVIFPAAEGGYRVQCVPTRVGSFGMRKMLPEAWAGLAAEELVEVTGVSDAVFCHKGRFIAGAGSRVGAMKLADLAASPTDAELEDRTAKAEAGMVAK